MEMEMEVCVELFIIFHKHYISDKRETGERKWRMKSIDIVISY